MKSIIRKIISTSIAFCLAILSLQAQVSHITCSLENCAAVSSNTLEFDLFIMNDGSSPLKLNSVAFGINVNGEILSDINDVLGMSFTGTSDLPESITATFSFGYASSLRQVKLTSLPSAIDAMQAPFLPVNVKIRIGRFSVTNQTHSWISGTTTNFELNTIVGFGNTNTGAVAYVSNDAVGTNFNDGNNRNTAVNCALVLGCIMSTYFADADSDGFGSSSNSVIACSQPSGFVSNNTDCNDNPVSGAAIHPDANDVCNNMDDNCNGMVDENAIVASINPGVTQTICDGASVTLAANGGAGISYQWKRGTKLIAGATTQSYKVKKAGNYTVVETNGLNCNSTSPLVKVLVSPTPDAIITAGNLNLCAGKVLLTANSGTGYTYQWMKGKDAVQGATNISYKATKKGTYKVIVTNSSTCSKTSVGVNVTNSCKQESGEEVMTALTLYPNPNEGAFTIEITLESAQSIVLRLFNVLGNEVYTSDEGEVSGRFTKQLDLSILPSGTYFLRVTIDGENEMKKIVVQH